MNKIHFSRNIMRSQIKHVNNIHGQITRLFCTQSFSPKLDLPKLEGVSYLNKRLLELRNAENPSESIRQEIKDLRQIIDTMNISNDQKITDMIPMIFSSYKQYEEKRKKEKEEALAKWISESNKQDLKDFKGICKVIAIISIFGFGGYVYNTYSETKNKND